MAQEQHAAAKNGAAKYIRAAVVILAIAGCIYLGIRFYPFLDGILTEQSARDEFRDFLRQGGVKGFAVFLLVHIAQMVMLLPGEPVELLAGMAWGGFGGAALCLLGAVVGTALIFFCVKTLSALFITDRMRESVKKYAFLRSEQRLYGLIFFLFLIPGTPKDLITYMAPMLPVKPFKLLCVAVVARIPLMAVSTFAGANLYEGDLAHSALLFGVLMAVGVVGVLLNELIIRRRNKAKEPPENSPE